MNGDTVLTIDSLSKTYPNGKLAVDSLSLTLRRGEVFGILGPNGSGKTTTILMILGLTEPTKGSINILGLDPLRTPLEIKRRVGYMPDTVGFYDDLSGFDNLDYSARFLGLKSPERDRRIRENMEKMGIAESMYDKVGTYSHGMRRRLGLAEVLVKQPEIAILDEPTQGLDPESASEFLDLIRYLKQQEKITVLLSSHQLNQVQSVCDRVGLFSAGNMFVSGTIAELASTMFGGKFAISVKAENGNIAEKLEEMEGVSTVEQDGDWEYWVECEKDVRSEIVETITSIGGKIYELSMHRHTLDSIYMSYFQEVNHAT